MFLISNQLPTVLYHSTHWPTCPMVSVIMVISPNGCPNGEDYQVMYTKPHIPAVTW
ncbi:hypothetical protein HanRHA438_Chr01g0028631 [Helianthus annuus]|nr:hypothetical protein HanRHA438_Chr01g0028631 [Helianthus annuus]